VSVPVGHLCLGARQPGTANRRVGPGAPRAPPDTALRPLAWLWLDPLRCPRRHRGRSAGLGDAVMAWGRVTTQRHETYGRHETQYVEAASEQKARAAAIPDLGTPAWSISTQESATWLADPSSQAPSASTSWVGTRSWLDPPALTIIVGPYRDGRRVARTAPFPPPATANFLQFLLDPLPKRGSGPRRPAQQGADSRRGHRKGEDVAEERDDASAHLGVRTD
jgi:hypothetical protein